MVVELTPVVEWLTEQPEMVSPSGRSVVVPIVAIVVRSDLTVKTVVPVQMETVWVVLHEVGSESYVSWTFGPTAMRGHCGKLPDRENPDGHWRPGGGGPDGKDQS